VLSDLDETFSLFLQLSHISHAVSRSDLTAAKSWATSAEDQHVALLSSSSQHFDVVSMAMTSLAVDAFSCGTSQEPILAECHKSILFPLIFIPFTMRFRHVSC
jgi:hypothetical protein